MDMDAAPIELEMHLYKFHVWGFVADSHTYFLLQFSFLEEIFLALLE